MQSTNVDSRILAAGYNEKQLRQKNKISFILFFLLIFYSFKK